TELTMIIYARMLTNHRESSARLSGMEVVTHRLGSIAVNSNMNPTAIGVSTMRRSRRSDSHAHHTPSTNTNSVWVIVTSSGPALYVTAFCTGTLSTRA